MKATSKPSYRFIVAGIACAVLAVGAWGIYWFIGTRSQDLTNVDVITSLVSRHMVLPTDETPALMTVVDPSKLGTDFLKNTKLGDKVLVYQQHKRAIIYRPSTDRIIDVGPVVIDDVVK